MIFIGSNSFLSLIYMTINLFNPKIYLSLKILISIFSHSIITSAERQKKKKKIIVVMHTKSGVERSKEEVVEIVYIKNKKLG